MRVRQAVVVVLMACIFYGFASAQEIDARGLLAAAEYAYPSSEAPALFSANSASSVLMGEAEDRVWSSDILIGLIAYALVHRWQGANRFGLALFVAGGVSNWVDRVADCRVVDFLNVGVGPIRTGIFNVADVAILVGSALFLWSEYSRGRK